MNTSMYKKFVINLTISEQQNINGGTNLATLPIIGPIIGVVIANEIFNKMKV